MLACTDNGGPKPRGGSAGAAADIAEPAEPGRAPSNADELLVRLHPLPGGDEAIELRYRISGTYASGSFVIALQEGGYRHERWEIVWAGADPDEPFVSKGTTIVTPSQTWTGLDGQPGERSDNPEAGLAAAWTTLEDRDRKAAVVAAIDEWHAVLAEQRAANPGERATIEGIDCLQTRIAAQNLCMWEEAGVFLRYEGALLTIELEHIDRAPKGIDAARFVLPPRADGARKLETRLVDADGRSLDPELLLSELADGNYAVIAGLSAPRLGLEQLAETPEPAPR